MKENKEFEKEKNELMQQWIKEADKIKSVSRQPEKGVLLDCGNSGELGKLWTKYKPKIDALYKKYNMKFKKRIK